jgi:hypothetical protein
MPAKAIRTDSPVFAQQKCAQIAIRDLISVSVRVERYFIERCILLRDVFD